MTSLLTTPAVRVRLTATQSGRFKPFSVQDKFSVILEIECNITVLKNSLRRYKHWSNKNGFNISMHTCFAKGTSLFATRSIESIGTHLIAQHTSKPRQAYHLTQVLTVTLIIPTLSLAIAVFTRQWIDAVGRPVNGTHLDDVWSIM